MFLVCLLLLLSIALLIVFQRKTNPLTAILQESKRQSIDRIKAGWIYAQAQFESADFTSSLYKRCKNCFGIKKHSLRSVSFDVDNGYCCYSYVDECVRDFFEIPYIIKCLKTSKSLYEYIQKIKSYGYFTAPLLQYYNGVLHYLNKNGRL